MRRNDEIAIDASGDCGCGVAPGRWRVCAKRNKTRDDVRRFDQDAPDFRAGYFATKTADPLGAPSLTELFSNSLPATSVGLIGRAEPDLKKAGLYRVTLTVDLHDIRLDSKDGNFIVRFVTANGRSLAILVPEKNAAVLPDLQEHMPYGLAVRDIDDADCQAWEPSGDEFLSPALVEAACMRATLPETEFRAWFGKFLPRLDQAQPATLFLPATVSDRADGKIAHLDGVNLSRAWCWRALAPFCPDQAMIEQTIRAHLDEGGASAPRPRTVAFIEEHGMGTAR